MSTFAGKKAVVSLAEMSLGDFWLRILQSVKEAVPVSDDFSDTARRPLKNGGVKVVCSKRDVIRVGVCHGLKRGEPQRASRQPKTDELA